MIYHTNLSRQANETLHELLSSLKRENITPKVESVENDKIVCYWNTSVWKVCVTIDSTGQFTVYS